MNRTAIRNKNTAVAVSKRFRWLGAIETNNQTKEWIIHLSKLVLCKLYMGCWPDMAFSLSHKIKMNIINIVVI